MKLLHEHSICSAKAAAYNRVIEPGKFLPVRATEVVVRFRRPPVALFDELSPSDANYLRFRVGPKVMIGIGARRKAPGEGMTGEDVELDALDDTTDDMQP